MQSMRASPNPFELPLGVFIGALVRPSRVSILCVGALRRSSKPLTEHAMWPSHTDSLAIWFWPSLPMDLGPMLGIWRKTTSVSSQAFP